MQDVVRDMRISASEAAVIHDWIHDQAVAIVSDATIKFEKGQKTQQLKSKPRFLHTHAVRPVPLHAAAAYHSSNVMRMQDNPDWLQGFLSHPERAPVGARHTLESPLQGFMTVSMTHDTERRGVASLPLAMQVRRPVSVWNVEHHVRVWNAISVATVAQILHHHGMATCFPFFFSYGRVVGRGEDVEDPTAMPPMEDFYKALNWDTLPMASHVVEELKRGTPSSSAYRVVLGKKQAIEGFGKPAEPDTPLAALLRRQIDAGVGKIALSQAERAMQEYYAKEAHTAEVAERAYQRADVGYSFESRDAEVRAVLSHEAALKDGADHDVRAASVALQRELMNVWRGVTVTHALVCEHMVPRNLWNAMHSKDFITQHLDSFLVQVWAGVASLNRAGFFHNDMHPAMIGVRPLPRPTDMIYDVQTEDGEWVRITCRNQWFMPMLYNFDQAGSVKRAALSGDGADSEQKRLLHHRAWAYDDVMEMLAALMDMFMRALGRPDAMISHWLGLYFALTPEISDPDVFFTFQGEYVERGELNPSADARGLPKSLREYIAQVKTMETSAAASAEAAAAESIPWHKARVYEKYKAQSAGGMQAYLDNLRTEMKDTINPALLGAMDFTEEERVEMIALQHSDQVRALQQDPQGAANRVVRFLTAPSLVMKGVDRVLLGPEARDAAIGQEHYIYHTIPSTLPAEAAEDVKEAFEWQEGLHEHFWTMDSRKAKGFALELNLRLRRTSLFGDHRHGLHPHFAGDSISAWRSTSNAAAAAREVEVAPEVKMAEVASDHDEVADHEALPYIGDLLPVVEAELPDPTKSTRKDLWSVTEAESISVAAFSDALHRMHAKGTHPAVHGFTTSRSVIIAAKESTHITVKDADAIVVCVLKGRVMVGGTGSSIGDVVKVMVVPADFYKETQQMLLVPGGEGAVVGLHMVRWVADEAYVPTTLDPAATDAFIAHSLEEAEEPEVPVPEPAQVEGEDEGEDLVAPDETLGSGQEEEAVEKKEVTDPYADF